MIVRVIPSKNLTLECWSVQMNGLTACKGCEFKDTDQCGGKKIRETKKNAKGISIPLGKRM